MSAVGRLECSLVAEVRSFVYLFNLSPVTLFTLLLAGDYRLEIILDFILFLIICCCNIGG